jgi:hypothetical protein
MLSIVDRQVASLEGFHWELTMTSFDADAGKKSHIDTPGINSRYAKFLTISWAIFKGKKHT